MCKVVAFALAFWIGLCIGSTASGDGTTPRDAAICDQYERLAALYQERINGVEKFCHSGVSHAAH